MEEVPRSLLAGCRAIALSEPEFFTDVFARKTLFLYVLGRIAGAEVAAPVGEAEIRRRLRAVYEQRREMPLKKWGKTELFAMHALLELLAGDGSAARSACDDLGALQEPDGSFCHNPVSTACAFLALNEAAPGSPARERCLRYILDAQHPDGTWRYFHTDVWDTSLIVRAYHLHPHFAARALPGALEFLRRSQNEDGGWGFRSGIESDNDTTACVVLALEPYERGAAEPLRRAAAYLERMRQEDGLWRTWQSAEDQPAKDCVAHVISAADALRGVHRMEVGAARRWLVNHLQAEPDPYRRWTAVWFRSLSYGVLEMGRTLGARSALAAEGVQVLRAAQNPDGGWGPAPGERSTPGDTGLAVAGLLEHGDAACPAVHRGLAFLMSTQRSDGSWAANPSMVGPRPLLIEMATDSHAFAGWGLATACHAAVPLRAHAEASARSA